jgi:hypothetical protein
MNLDAIWEKALASPIALSVASRNEAISLRQQLYRYRHRIQRDNRLRMGAAVSEYDAIVIKLEERAASSAGEASFKLILTTSPVNILSLEEI